MLLASRNGKTSEAIATALAFDDILLEPGESRVLPDQVSLATCLASGGRLQLSIPLMSAAMDTVTEERMAIELARAGGLGVVHRNNDAAAQATQVAHVKRYESGVVSDPVCVSSSATVADARRIKLETGYSALPVVDGGIVVGIVTNRDLRFETRQDRKIGQVMTPRSKLVTVRPGTGLNRARDLMHANRIERVIVEDSKQRLRGLITVKDILLSEAYPDACKDSSGSLRVAAAVGVNDRTRIEALVGAGADAIVVDTAHGHSSGVLKWVAELRRWQPKALIVAGNVATAAGAQALAAAGADAVKVGVGPGSICTTRVIAGIGVPQFSAIANVAKGLSRRKRRPGIIADGGIRFSGDVAKALAAGADAVMVGGMLAGTAEAPGETELYQGRAYKSYRGMGSLGAMQLGSADRYFQRADTEPGKLVPEGVEGRVPYKGPVQEVIAQLTGGLRAAMGYTGAPTIAALHKGSRFVRVTAAGVRESHVHDIQLTKEAPNYRVD